MMSLSSLQNHPEIWGIPTCGHPSSPVTEVHVEAFVAGHIAGLSGPYGTLALAEVQFAELVIIHLVPKPEMPQPHPLTLKTHPKWGPKISVKPL